MATHRFSKDNHMWAQTGATADLAGICFQKLVYKSFYCVLLVVFMSIHVCKCAAVCTHNIFLRDCPYANLSGNTFILTFISITIT